MTMKSKIEVKRISKKPVSVGQTLKLEIESYGKDKDGVAIVGETNFIVIVPGTKIGKVYDVYIKKVTKNMAFGEVK